MCIRDSRYSDGSISPGHGPIFCVRKLVSTCSIVFAHLMSSTMMIDHCYGETHLTKPLSNEPIGVASKLAEVSVASRCVELLQAELDCIRWPGVSADFGPGGVS